LFARFRFQLVAKGEGGVAAVQRLRPKPVIDTPFRAKIHPDDIGFQAFKFLIECLLNLFPGSFCLATGAK